MSSASIELKHVHTENIIFNPETHTYKLYGVDAYIPSVTKIINPKGVRKNAKIQAACELGIEVHDAFHTFLSGDKTEYDNFFKHATKAAAENLKLGYASWESEKRFVAEFRCDDETFYVGGSCDAHLIANDDGLRVIELKTTTKESNDHLIQLAAYTKFAAFREYDTDYLDPDLDVAGFLAYMALNPGGAKIKKLTGEDLEMFWLEFHARVLAYFKPTVLPEIFEIVDGGEYREMSQEQIQALIEEYRVLDNTRETIEKQQDKIRTTLDHISSVNNLTAFEINGAKYAKIKGYRKSFNTNGLEVMYPERVHYVPFTRVTIG